MERILIVDDEAMILGFYERILKLASYVVDSASDGEEALRLAGKKQPDLLITDFKMTGMQGDELSEKIFTKFPKVAIMMITSSLVPSSYPHLIMGKPISPHLLIAKVKYLLSK